jgi:ribonuclease HII
LDFWTIERDLRAIGYELICGVDEAGRGPLAGPVFAAAVILPFGLVIPHLNDSKKISEKIRDALFHEITSAALTYGIASADNREIDDFNILNATYLAMNRSLEMLAYIPDISLIDGNRNQGIAFNSKCVVGGDGKSASIAAASILAKVSRDRLMFEMAREYPQYGFDKHKGYGTKLHIENLRKHGACEIHRMTFLSRILPDTQKLKS